MPAPPNTEGRALAASQALVAMTLVLIQIRIMVGNRPMGLNPPELFGSKTMSTKSSAWAQEPARSKARKSSTKAAMASSDRRAKARGAALSPPRPVLIGNVIAAILIAIGIIGLQCSASGSM